MSDTSAFSTAVQAPDSDLPIDLNTLSLSSVPGQKWKPSPADGKHPLLATKIVLLKLEAKFEFCTCDVETVTPHEHLTFILNEDNSARNNDLKRLFTLLRESKWAYEAIKDIWHCVLPSHDRRLRIAMPGVGTSIYITNLEVLLDFARDRNRKLCENSWKGKGVDRLAFDAHHLFRPVGERWDVGIWEDFLTKFFLGTLLHVTACFTSADPGYYFVVPDDDEDERSPSVPGLEWLRDKKKCDRVLDNYWSAEEQMNIELLGKFDAGPGQEVNFKRLASMIVDFFQLVQDTMVWKYGYIKHGQPDFSIHFGRIGEQVYPIPYAYRPKEERITNFKPYMGWKRSFGGERQDWTAWAPANGYPKYVAGTLTRSWNQEPGRGSGGSSGGTL